VSSGVLVHWTLAAQVAAIQALGGRTCWCRVTESGEGFLNAARHADVDSSAVRMTVPLHGDSAAEHAFPIRVCFIETLDGGDKMLALSLSMHLTPKLSTMRAKVAGQQSM
jgi:hypothetical protein